MTLSLHSSDAPVVGVVLGSDWDSGVMSDASPVLTDFGVPREVEVVSAHRTPDEVCVRDIERQVEAKSRRLKDSL